MIDLRTPAVTESKVHSIIQRTVISYKNEETSSILNFSSRQILNFKGDYTVKIN